MEDEVFKYYAEMNSDGKCISICGTLGEVNDDNFILISEEDYSLVGKVFVNGCFIGDSSLEFSKDGECFVPKVEDKPTTETPSIELLAEKIEQLTKILEENNITI